jgi:large repetitive protein
MSERARTINERAIFKMGILFIAVAGLFVGLTSFTDNAYAQTASSNNVAVVNEQTQVTLSGTDSFTPVPGNTLTYYWQQMSGDPVSFTNGSPTITFTTPAVSAGETQYLKFALIVTDNHGASSSTAFTLQVVHVDQPPTVVTQHELVVPELSSVTLTGTGTSPDNYTLTYQWTQTSGDAVTLATSNQPTATFTAPAVGSAPSKTLQFKLTADDGNGGQGSDYETVTVMSSSYYSSPSINCGSIIGGARGYAVTLQASVNNPANLPLSYSWQQVSGLPVQLSSADTLNPTFTVPNGPDASELAFELTVSNGPTPIGSCESYVYTQLGFAMPPVANAGPDQTVNGLDQVTLDGTKSTGVGSLSYSWQQVSGVPVQLLYSGTASPQFVAPDVPVGSSQVLVFELQVSNGLGKSADQVTITVIHPNVPPTAIIKMQ